MLATALVVSCSPVLNKKLMKQGVRDIPLSYVKENVERYRGQLFILGGLVVETRLTEKGSLIEAVSVPVDAYGKLRSGGRYGERFYALYPRAAGILDPVIYAKGREITLAGVFRETMKGRIDEMEYVYPVFEIKAIYLWEEKEDHYLVPVYPWYYGYPYGWYDPWYRYPRWRYYPPPPSWYHPRP